MTLSEGGLAEACHACYRAQFYESVYKNQPESLIIPSILLNDITPEATVSPKMVLDA